MSMIATLLCGTDGSTDAQRAVDYAARLARQLQAEVVLVHAIGLLEHLPADTADSDMTVGDWATEQLAQAWSAPLREHAVTYSCVAEAGPPLLAIPRIAEQVGADVIIVASHGRGGSSAVPLGSTAHGMVQVVNRPVLVVPSGSADR